MKYASSSVLRAFRHPSGNAIVISLIAVSITVLAVIGVSSLVTDGAKRNKADENSNAAYFATEGILETALYDAAGHVDGYQVEEDPDNPYNNLSFQDGTGTSRWSISNRTIFLDTEATEDDNGYEGSEYAGYDGFMVVPAPNHGNNPKDQNWNILLPGRDASIPLFVDNTSCAQSDASCS